jgi:hypothetical protein
MKNRSINPRGWKVRENNNGAAVGDWQGRQRRERDSEHGSRSAQVCALPPGADFFIPEKDFALAILTNSDDGGILTAQAFAWALDIYFDIKLKLPRPIKTPTSELKEYTGRYRIGTECFDLKAKGEYLMYDHIPLGGFPTPDTPPGPAMPPMRFAFYEKDKVIGLDEPYKDALGDFIRSEKGKLQYFRVGGRAHKKIK